MEDLFGYAYGSFVLELDGHEPVGKMLGTIRPDSRFCLARRIRKWSGPAEGLRREVGTGVFL